MNLYPSIRITLKLIRDMGLRASYVPEFHEFRITIPNQPTSAYFTQSRHDALFSARAMRTAANVTERHLLSDRMADDFSKLASI